MNKVAFITGASRGIGRETALEFARQGFDVAISARTLEEGERHAHALSHADGAPLAGSLRGTAAAIEALGRRAWIIPMDLLDATSVTAAAEQVLREAGRVDVLVNNAIYQGSDLNLPLLQLTADTLERIYRAYLLAPVLLCQALARHMLERGDGVIINVTSGAGESNPPVPAGQGGWGYAYGAGKAMVSRLSGVLAVELGGAGLRAYTINPGVVRTEALQATIGEQGVIALRNGSAPPSVPAQVMRWLALEDREGKHQRRTINVQPFALEQRIVADWREPSPLEG
ncbi:SDR family NAD(P)-dependent oxidoreductase [Pseudomonas sp. R5(2019)]|uniref:SDR family NAD(P)-dependent oxidoreductase n=1 Tax=Pseudomonas sp. R5(2019) TaxID=2697566 RepID=UPI001412D4AD|nr:SDR family oxidoreductase [Pseudomonas sp. R5(2019)]NBA93708.1 SDR family NAD(P)-dependent oxidoreductase [Pseudomonas sp. R5(2019)]